MKVYIFGNQDHPEDNVALIAAKNLEKEVEGVDIVIIQPNEDVPFEHGENAVIMDVVEGLNEIRLIEGKDIDRLVLPPRSSVHDFDLAFQLKYLKKLGKLGEVRIIGIPKGKPLTEADYFSIHSILRKLVAQDMQGS